MLLAYLSSKMTSISDSKQPIKTISFPVEESMLAPKGEINVEKFTSTLNELGKEGWELTNSLGLNLSNGPTKNVIAIFKRAK
jgi:hypothetical protein